LERSSLQFHFFLVGGGVPVYIHSLMEYGARAQFCIHTVAMVFSAQFAEGGGARPTHLTLSTPSSRVTSAPPTLSPARISSYLYSPSSPLCHSLCCHNFSGFLAGRETREGWPLLTIETEANGDSKRAVSWLDRWVCRAGTRDFLFCLGCSCRPSTKYFFSSSYIISIPLSPSASKLGRQPCWVACLLVCVSVVKFGYHSFISLFLF
jgi:hypothetical protein